MDGITVINRWNGWSMFNFNFFPEFNVSFECFPVSFL